MKLKKFAALLLALALIASLAACGSSSSSSSTASADTASTDTSSADSAAEAPEGYASYNIGVTTWGSGVPILDSFGDANEFTLGAIGCTSTRVSDDFTADKEVTNVQNLVAAGVAGVCNQASAVTTVPQIAKICKDAGIPIVFNVSCGLEDDLATLQDENEFYCGAIDADMYLDGQIIAEKAYEDGCRTATMIGGNVGDQDIDKRMNGFQDKFEELGGEVLANARCTDNSECPTKAEDMLSANPADCIYATVGDYVAGSMSAIDNLGLSTKIYCSCTDKDSAQYIAEGKIAAGNDGIAIAAYISPTLIINYLDGHQILDDNGKAPRLQTIPFTITADNAQTYLDIFYGEGSTALTEAMVQALCYRYNENVTYQDYVDLINNLSLDYLVEAHK